MEPTSYVDVATLAWMLWDILINIDDELEWIWKRPVSWVRFVYGFIRYIPMIQSAIDVALQLRAQHQVSPSFCRNMVVERYTILLVVILVVQASLVVRVYILYFNSKGVLQAICTLLVVEIIVMAITLALVARRLSFTANCATMLPLPPSNIAFWAVALLVEAVLFVSVLGKLRQHRDFSSGFGASRFISFAKGGAWASAIIFVAILLSTIFHQLRNFDFHRMGYNLIIGTISCTGAKDLLSLRKAANSWNNNDCAPTTLEFDQPGTVKFVSMTHAEGTTSRQCDLLDDGTCLSFVA